MSNSGPSRESGACSLSIHTIHQVVDRLVDGGLPDPSCAEVADVLGVGRHVVLAVLAGGSDERLRTARRQEPTQDGAPNIAGRASPRPDGCSA